MSADFNALRANSLVLRANLNALRANSPVLWANLNALRAISLVLRANSTTFHLRRYKHVGGGEKNEGYIYSRFTC